MKGYGFLFLGLLFGLHTMSCDRAQPAEPAVSVDSVALGVEPVAGVLAPGTLPVEGLRIAWVNMDSLLHSYDLYFEMEREMANLSAAAEKELTSKGKDLERRMLDFQDQVQKGLMTRSEAQKKQEDLAVEQQQFLQLQESKRQQLMEEEQVRLRRVQNAINDFIARYNQEVGYHYILNGSSTALFADPRLSITAEVLRGLNAEYAATRQAAKAK